MTYKRLYPPVINHALETAFAVEIARSIVGNDKVNAELEPLMGSEDFAFMLQSCPGNIILIGNGNTAGVHDARYDFNDSAIPYGIAYFRQIIERGMPISGVSALSRPSATPT